MDGDSSDSVPGIKGCGLKTIIKRFPEITDRTKLSLDEFITLCEEKSKTESYKIYDEILNNSDILKRNFKLMQLQDVDIPNDYKLKILSRFNEQTNQIDKLTLLKLALKYQISNNWPNFDSWLKDTFSGIIHG
jgi:5'-3' exonuclease